MRNEVHLNKHDVKKAAWRWIFFHQSSHNYERMMGAGFAHCLSGALEKLYAGNKTGLAEALKRNMSFFNTEPQIGAVIPGIALALEESRANDKNFDTEIISSTKNALMGPLAGIGDSLLIGTLNPILLSIGIGLSTDGSPIGPLVFFFLWMAIVVPLEYYMFLKGYGLGMEAVTLLMNEQLKEKITTGLTIVGLIVIGGVASMTVKASIALTYVSGDMTINIQQILDKIMPNLLPLVISLVGYYLVAKRNWSTNHLMAGILAFAALMVGLGVM